MATPHTLSFSQVIVTTLDINTASAFTVPADCIWKVESAGIAGTKGLIYLQDSSSHNLAILFSSFNNDDYGAPLPFWLSQGFAGSFMNASEFKSVISITEYVVVP